MMFIELNYLYRQICAKQVSKVMTQRLEKEIPVLVCKMKIVFLPRWFNVMQHLLVHLPWEAGLENLYSSGECIAKKEN
jgi:hypothetical protein